MVLSNGTKKKKTKKINIPKTVAYGTFRRNRLHSAARTNNKSFKNSAPLVPMLDTSAIASLGGKVDEPGLLKVEMKK